MISRKILWLVLSLTGTSVLHAADEVRYITDEVTVPLRSAPDNEADLVGVLNSGDRVTIQRSLGPQSYTQITTSRGAEGWLPSRYLSEDRPAGVRLKQVEAQRDEARARVRQLEQELNEARDRLAQAAPAFQLADDNERLQQRITELEQERVELARTYNEERARRQTLITGAALIGGGVLLGLVLPLLGRRRKRGYGEL